MKKIHQFLGLLLFTAIFSANIQTAHHEDPLLEAINNSDRNIKYSSRDAYRNPYQTLSFFQIKPTMSVLELSAGGLSLIHISGPRDGLLSRMPSSA